MKLGIVGFGYWGKIILRNLESMGKVDTEICDITLPKEDKYKKYKFVNDYQKLDCEYVFITTPTKTHFEICKYFLEKNIHVFCEKPLTTSSSEAKLLYDIAFKHKVILFTDWVFTFNSHIETIKKDYDNGKLGKIRSISMNRLNLGPERFDVNARWDLASHDISIIQYLFSEQPVNVRWTDYKRNNDAEQDDSSLGFIQFNDFIATINVSWNYRKKVRECVFEFEKYFIVWDDYKRFLQYEDSSNVSFPIYSGNLSYPCGEYSPPLINAINSFFNLSNEEMIEQMKLTVDIIKILEV
ncbi:MAG: gfo/Idh/MocA family oxidoreductase [Candidatus Lokiarchaeota archaeon]|nr:gfo/Idh/MocA family oxidoreductase [Candidatus Lokiarchaeota archaeon]